MEGFSWSMDKAGEEGLLSARGLRTDVPADQKRRGREYDALGRGVAGFGISAGVCACLTLLVGGLGTGVTVALMNRGGDERLVYVDRPPPGPARPPSPPPPSPTPYPPGTVVDNPSAATAAWKPRFARGPTPAASQPSAAAVPPTTQP
jgi:hypothetical protein